MREPYDWDAYAESFFPKAEELEGKAKKSQAEGDNEGASEFFLYVNQGLAHMRFQALTYRKPSFCGLPDFKISSPSLHETEIRLGEE
jgi:hypothetical protein